LKALAGIRVLDFSRVLAGPLATQLLAELGAEVIKVERPGVGDESRDWEPRTSAGESAYFFSVNRGKRSITLDLKTPRGIEIAAELAAQADVVVENFLPDYMDKLGLGYAALSKGNPQLVYVSATGFGQTGPYRDRKGYDTIFQALSGIMSLTGHPDGPPAKVGVPFADLTSGLWIAICVLTGLVGRASSGRGCHVDFSMLDAQVNLLTIAAARLFALGEDPQRSGTEHPGRVPSAAFQCRDGGWIHISGSDQHWPALCEVLDLAELAGDASLRRNGGRLRARERVMSALSSAMAKRDRAELVARLIAADVPVGEVNSVRETLQDPHVLARGMQQSFHHPVQGEFPALRQPLQMTGFDDPYVGTPPQLGADTKDVLQRYLGLDDQAVQDLKTAGVV
jgi:crotonobetainyl-CoA:carnitine CoA-transferase CaiB-like acyl-CoA transferase